MKIPGVDRAVLDSAKVQNYLLSREHPVGSAKARFFSQLGFDQNNWMVLRDALYGFAGLKAQLGATTRFGQKYVVHGTITGPSGRTAGIVAVWIVLKEEDFPRFVTAYPGAEP